MHLHYPPVLSLSLSVGCLQLLWLTVIVIHPTLNIFTYLWNSALTVKVHDEAGDGGPLLHRLLLSLALFS